MQKWTILTKLLVGGINEKVSLKFAVSFMGCAKVLTESLRSISWTIPIGCQERRNLRIARILRTIRMMSAALISNWIRIKNALMSRIKRAAIMIWMMSALLRIMRKISKHEVEREVIFQHWRAQAFLGRGLAITFMYVRAFLNLAAVFTGYQRYRKMSKRLLAPN